MWVMCSSFMPYHQYSFLLILPTDLELWPECLLGQNKVWPVSWLAIELPPSNAKINMILLLTLTATFGALTFLKLLLGRKTPLGVLSQVNIRCLQSKTRHRNAIWFSSAWWPFGFPFALDCGYCLWLHSLWGPTEQVGSKILSLPYYGMCSFLHIYP